MKFQFKIYNPDIVDCSSCPNTIYPDPESREVLLKILLRVCESEVVTKIGKFSFWFGDIALQSPNVYGYDYKGWKRDDSRYILQTGKKSEFDKISGFYIENEDDAKKRIENLKYFGGRDAKKAYYIKPGLDGIRKGIKIIKTLYNGQKEVLPIYLKNFELRHFSFTCGVIWEMNEEHEKLENGLYNTPDYERDSISGGSSELGFDFGFSNFGGDSYSIFHSERYLNHLNSITEILDQIVPGKYEAGPLDYYGLLGWGVLKKEGRKLIPADLKDFYNAEIRFDNDLSRIHREKDELEHIIIEQKALTIQKLAEIVNISLKSAENLIYELIGSGVDGFLDKGVLKFTSEPYEITPKLFNIIDKIEEERFKIAYREIVEENEGSK
ncbi:MAG: hypothetical protein ACFFE4_09455 [Candidatus Thorarchaeota archaeon]